MTGSGGKAGAIVAALAAAAIVGYGVWVSKHSTPSRIASPTKPKSPPSMPRRSPGPLSTPPTTPCPIRFEEVARRFGVVFEHQRGDNGDYWLPETMGGGAAWFDLDGDGWQDLYVVQGKRAAFGRDALFLNDRGKRFARLPDVAVPADPEFGQGVVAGDFDHDGFDDLYVTNFTRHRLYRNNGDGTLADHTAAAGLGSGCTFWGTSAAFGDLDADGDLDLVVCNYADYAPVKCSNHLSGRREYCGPDKFKGRPVVFLRNLGDGRFIDDSDASGMGEPLGKCLGVVVARFVDAPRRPQVFVANDLQSNFFFTPALANGRVRYRDVAAELRVDRNGEGVRQANMGVAVGDYDRDGRLDLYSTHYFQEHDTLWKNLGDAGFRDATKSARLFVPTLPQLSWGTQFLDADGDGWLDLFVTSGNINNDPDSVYSYRMTPQLFWNRGAIGDHAFDDVSLDAGPFFNVGHVGRGSATGDFDRDGRPDLVVVHHHENVALLHNRSTGGKAFGLDFVGRTSSRDGLGVRVVVTGPGVTKPLVREIHGGGSYLSADARSVLIGVGDLDGPFDVVALWPTGRVDRCEGVRPGAWLTLLEGESAPVCVRPFAPREPAR
jgi:hypothetical protein